MKSLSIIYHCYIVCLIIGGLIPETIGETRGKLVHVVLK